MAKRRKTKSEKLLTELRRRGEMTHKQMVQFLLRGTGNKYSERTRRYYDPMLYGSWNGAPGFLSTYCSRTGDFGSYQARSAVTVSWS